MGPNFTFTTSIHLSGKKGEKKNIRPTRSSSRTSNHSSKVEDTQGEIQREILGEREETVKKKFNNMQRWHGQREKRRSSV